MPTDWTTLRVSEAAREAAEEQKHDDETWNEFIQRCGEHPRPERHYVDVRELREELQALIREECDAGNAR